MNAPSWFFYLLMLGGAVALFGGFALIMGLLYWFSPSRRKPQAQNPMPQRPNAPQSPRPNAFGTQRPGAFGSQGIPRSQSANWQSIPENERGASFFSGRPARVGSMHSTTVSVGGRSRRVLVDDEDWAILQMGQLPPFHVFFYNGGYVPWYAYPDYSPYMDYGDVPPGDFVPYDQVAPQYWDEQPPVADYAYTPDQENYQDYAAGAAMGTMDMGNTVPFEDVYRPSLPDDGSGYVPSFAGGNTIDPLGDPADSNPSMPFGDPLGDPADSINDFGSVEMSSSFDTGGFDAGSGSSDAS